MSALRYITEVIVCSGLFLVVYRWLLAKKVCFGLCRAFIVASMLLAAVIPAMNVPLLPENTFMKQAVLTGFDFFEEEPGVNTAERLALSVLRSFFWFNPFFWMAEKDLEEVQEWEADKDVLDEGIAAAFLGFGCGVKSEA